jgi:ankyrin repeat protein
LKVLQLFVERGANIHSLLPSGANVMHFAAAGGHIGVVKYLLEHQVAPDVKHDDGPTPLSLAASAGHAEVVRLLLSTGQVDVNQTSGGGRSALTWAVARGHKEVVNELMKSEAIDLNTRDGFATPLAIATVMGRETIFEMLFADPRFDKSSHIAFWLASMGTTVSVVKVLEDANSEWFYALYSKKALLLAAEYASEEVLQYLLDREIDTRERVPPPRSNPLLEEEITQFLLSGQTDIECGWYPLQCAVKSMDTGKVRAILKHPGIDINAQSNLNNNSETPLHVAVRHTVANQDVIRGLLDHPDIKVNVRNKDGRTPLACAATLGKLGVVQLFLSRDDVEKFPFDESGDTLLLLAAQKGHASTVDFLLSQPDTHVGHANHEGKTALALAVEFGHPQIVRRLLAMESGATGDDVKVVREKAAANLVGNANKPAKGNELWRQSECHRLLSERLEKE